jgi:DNA methyltransferase 1-associated protein 1
MGDVAQILGLNAGATASSAISTRPDAVAKELESLKPTGTTPAARTKTKKPKKLTGMQREVLELLESNHRVNHALYPGLSKLTLQQKWKERRDRPAVQWIRKSFQNPARAELAGEQEHQGGLTLTHWVKANVTPPEYVFARFNIKCDVVKYTDEEYEAALAHHVDPTMKWTKEETDVLLELCERHDLRWIVVADKYNTHAIAKGAYRSLEDIKYRYYEVARLVSEYRDRCEEADEEKPAGEIKNEPAVDGATPAATTKTPTPTATDTTTSSRYYRFNATYEKQRKRQLELAFTRSIEEENEVKRLTDELRTVEQQLKKVAVKVDTKKKKELSGVPYEIHREMPKGVFLRSQTLSLPAPHQKNSALSAKLLKKMELMLDEMGVPLRPMPTKQSCEMYDTLRQDIVGLLSLRKHVTAKQSEAQTLRERYQALTGKEYKPSTSSLPSRKDARRGEAGTGMVASGTGADAVETLHVGKGTQRRNLCIRSR